jgi:hypothetical protein
MSATLHKMAALMIACAAIAGCRETMHCDQGRSYQNGECRPYGDASGLDAGPSDTGIVDMGSDTNPDANPCNACATGRVCLLDGRHDAAAPDAGMGTCVECASDSDCDARMIDGGTFGDGGALPGRAICQDYACVFGCRDSGDCGGNPCLATGRCSEYPTYTSTNVPCARCDTDANCNGVTGYACIPFANGGHMGAYCLSNVGGLACSSRRRFTSTLSAVRSIDMAAADDYCIPSNNVTCEAVLSASAVPNTCSGMTCGVIGATATGICSSGHCSYTCNPAHGDQDCPAGVTCNSGSSTCM